MKQRQDIKQLLGYLIGTKNTLSNNILFIDFTGSHEKAQLLSQMWYWNSRTKIKGGWFCKTHDEWYDEIRIKRHSVRRFVKEFCELGFLETRLKKFDGVPKPHYLLNTDELINQLVTFCDSNKLLPSQIVTVEGDNLMPSIEGDNLMPSINIDLEQRFNTERESAPANFQHQPIGSTPTPPPDSAPPPSPKRSRFVRPEVSEMIEYMEDLFLNESWRPRFINNPDETAAQIHDYYTANGWKVGRNAMKDWKAACRNWLKNNEKYAPKYRPNVSRTSPQQQPQPLVSEETHRRALARTLAALGVTGGGS